MSSFARTACLVILVCLTAYLGYSFATGSVWGDQMHVWQVVWGRYVWADAYSGFTLFALLIYAYERNWKLTLLLFILACSTGNMVNAAWLLWRGPDLFNRIRQSHKGETK